MLRAIELSKRISPTFEVQSICLDVPSGEIIGLMGPNGSGKSTLIRLLAGVYRPDHGRIVLDNQDITESPGKMRHVVGVVTDHLLGYPWLTLHEYLIYCGSLYQLHARESIHRAEPLLDRFGLARYVNSPISHLSNGMKQKLNFVRATLNNPRVLLLDEPTLGLDPPSVWVLSDFVGEFRDGGGAVLLCTHDIGFAARMSDVLLFLAGGQIQSRHEMEDLPMSYVVDFSWNDDTRKAGPLAAELEEQGVTFEMVAECHYRLRYDSRRYSDMHRWILDSLRSRGAQVLGLESDRVRALERLYAITQGREGA